MLGSPSGSTMEVRGSHGGYRDGQMYDWVLCILFSTLKNYANPGAVRVVLML